MAKEKDRFKTENYSMLSEIFKAPVPKLPIIIDFTTSNTNKNSSESKREIIANPTSQQETINHTNNGIIDEIITPIQNQDINETHFRMESNFETFVDLDFDFMNNSINSIAQSSQIEFESLFNDTDFISSINFDFDTIFEDFPSIDFNVQQTAFEFENYFPLYSAVPVCEN